MTGQGKAGGGWGCADPKEGGEGTHLSGSRCTPLAPAALTQPALEDVGGQHHAAALKEREQGVVVWCWGPMRAPRGPGLCDHLENGHWGLREG